MLNLLLNNETAKNLGSLPPLTKNTIWKGDSIMAKKSISKLKRICQVEGCNQKYHANGYCSRHNMQIKRHGKVLKRTRFDPNKFIIEGDICRIKLYDRNGHEVSEAIIDAEDHEKVKGMKWHRCTNGYVAYMMGRQWVGLHSVVLNTSKDKMIDHIDGDGLNCRKINLRKCINQQNSWNQGLRKNNTSGAKGVCWYEQTKKWKAQIRHGHGRKHLGYFKNKTDAIRAYNEAAVKYHGEFARLNLT